MKKFILILIGFFIGIIIFTPKENLYYFIQKQIQKENIYINSKISSNIKQLTLQDGRIFVNKINIITFQKTDIIFLWIYNKINIKNLKLSIGNYLLKNIDIIYSIFSPLNIKITATSNFGEIYGTIDLTKREIKIYIKNLKDYTLKKFLKHDKQGFYYYEKY